jgi:hypothetical protein
MNGLDVLLVVIVLVIAWLLARDMDKYEQRKQRQILRDETWRQIEELSNDR